MAEDDVARLEVAGEDLAGAAGVPDELEVGLGGGGGGVHGGAFRLAPANRVLAGVNPMIGSRNRLGSKRKVIGKMLLTGIFSEVR
ncbi:hypothetical protein GCM10009543_27240 [Leifsonia naganoensis]